MDTADKAADEPRGTRPPDVEFRLRNARAGVALSVSCGLYPAAYCLTTWAQPHRGTIPAVALGAVGGSPAMCAALAGTGDGARAVDDVVGLV